MATTALQIQNAAALKLGENQVASGDTSIVAVSLAAHYERCRRLLLTEHRWNFAVTRYQTGSTENAESWVGAGYKYIHSVPDDILELISVAPDTGHSYEAGRLFSNETQLTIKYVRDEDDVPLFPEMFCEALACYLAAENDRYIANSNTTKQSLMAEYSMWIAKAQFRNLLESPGIDQSDPYDDWEKSRYNGPVY